MTPTPRSGVRSAAGWRAYDRANAAVVLVLALALLGWALWWLQQGGDPGAEADEPPVRMKLSDQRFEMRVLAGRLLLAGPVADAAEAQALQAAAEAVFGAGKVDARLAPRAGTEPLRWRDHAGDIFKVLQATGGEPAIHLTGQQVRLEGEVAAEYARVAREVLARQWFGRQVVLDNQLHVASTAASAPDPAPSAAVVVAAAPTPAAAVATPAAPLVASAPATPAAATPALAGCAGLAGGVAVRFHPNVAALTDEGRKTLRGLLPCLAQGNWVVGNHTDANGDPEANQRLTQARAESVVAYLAGKGVAAARLSAKGFAATRPVAGNDTPEDRMKNRRVTFEPAP